MKRLVFLVTATSIGLLVLASSPAFGINILHSFPSDGTGGSRPCAGVVFDGSTLYGVTSQGTASGLGAIYRMNPNGTNYQVLHSFSYSEGFDSKEITLSGDTIYGTALIGGSGGPDPMGTVFRMKTDGTQFTVLHNFFYNGGVGSTPYSSVAVAGSWLYGTVLDVPGISAGTDQGSIYRLRTDGTGFEVVHQFAMAEGEPNGRLTISGNSVYGMTLSSVFRMNLDGTGFTVLKTGTFGTGGLTLIGSTLYGVNSQVSRSGGVFAINTDGTNYRMLKSGLIGDSNGCLTVSGSTLFGSLRSDQYSSDPSADKVFSINTDGTDYRVWYSSDTKIMMNGPVAVNGSVAYATSQAGGSGNSGMIFSVTVPEPSTIALVGIGCIGLLVWAWRRKRITCLTSIIMVLVAASAGIVQADMFGTGANQFTIDFVPISGATNPTSGYGIVNNDYRMGTYEITNAQWDKFKASLGVPVTGSYSQGGYNYSFYDYGTGTTNVPTNRVSWYEAAQFVNWLNTSTGNQPAYKFTGTQGTNNYRFVSWNVSDAGYDAANPYRNRDAFYYLPTENEWVKAAYWNGTSLQTYANASPNDLVSSSPNPAKWNYNPSVGAEPWNVGSGCQELNGTYDMMGNNTEWLESPYTGGDYGDGSRRGLRGGDWGVSSGGLVSAFRYSSDPSGEYLNIGFRVASVPEPSTLALLLTAILGGLLWRRRRT